MKNKMINGQELINLLSHQKGDVFTLMRVRSHIEDLMSVNNSHNFTNISEININIYEAEIRLKDKEILDLKKQCDKEISNHAKSVKSLLEANSQVSELKRSIENIAFEAKEYGLLMGMSEEDIENDHVYKIIKKYVFDPS